MCLVKCSEVLVQVSILSIPVNLSLLADVCMLGVIAPVPASMPTMVNCLQAIVCSLCEHMLSCPPPANSASMPLNDLECHTKVQWL